MLANGVIVAESSPYSSPIVMSGVKDGSFRLCMDFRRLNSVTVDAGQPQPVMHEMLKELGDAEIFSTIDLLKCYWKIPLTKRARELTAFTTSNGGQYVFNGTPFGLVNAGRTCSHFINQEVLAGLVHVTCLNYQDDIVIFSRTWAEHLTQIAIVLERLQIYGLACSLDKYHFRMKQLPFLGHTVHRCSSR